MDLIAAVYDDWGIGRDGTQPVALSADRKFFRQTTKGATVIVGRRTTQDFPRGQPLPGRVNILLSRRGVTLPGFTTCRSPQEAAEETKAAPRVFVIGGGGVYRAMLPYCTRAYITRVHTNPVSDTFLPNLAESPDWELKEILQSGVEEGIAYEMCLYCRRGENQ